MIREFLIEVYLLAFKFVFNLFKLSPIKNKVTFVVSFGDNSLMVFEEMRRQKIPSQAIFICEQPSYDFIKQEVDGTVLQFKLSNIQAFIQAIYHLATSKYVLIDNYFGFLASVNFKKETECIQLWHAAGAIKTFGLKDHSIMHRSKRANQRFKKVYEKFDKVIVGSNAMANLFIKAFGLQEKNILKTGIPRTDLFYDKVLKKQVRERIDTEYPYFKEKKIILYAPTFRDHQLEDFTLELDLNLLSQQLSDDYILILRLHPAIKSKIDIPPLYDDFVYDFSKGYQLQELLMITDILISDYSSIPYEFALLNKPMIFYPYDLEEYKNERGLWDDYEKLVPGPVVYNNEQLIEIIKSQKFNLKQIETFKTKWNQYSTGDSSKNLVDVLF